MRDTQADAAFVADVVREAEYAERRDVGYRPPDFLLPGHEARQKAKASLRRRLTASAFGLGASASVLLGIAAAMVIILVDPPPVPVLGEGMASKALVASSLWIVGVMAWLVWGGRK